MMELDRPPNLVDSRGKSFTSVPKVLECIGIERMLAAALFWPKSLEFPPTWVEHIPFAYWLIDAHRPAQLVELGTHSGNSYFAFCEAVTTLGLPTRCFAIDTWVGDEHSGCYDEGVFSKVSAHNDANFGSFSALVRSTFDAALPHFIDESIDLLHIDGKHTYEACKHDFESWLPKLSDHAIVLFHDTNVRERNFGVFRLWAELAGIYPHFEFLHGHGLGVLGVGRAIKSPLKDLFSISCDPFAIQAVRDVFWRSAGAVRARGQVQVFQAGLESLSQQLAGKDMAIAGLKELSSEAERILAANVEALATRDAQIASLQTKLAERNTQISDLQAIATARDAQIEGVCAVAAERDRHIAALEAVVAERDVLVAGLSARTAASDDQIVALSAAAAERDSQIANLNAIVDARDRTIATIYGSTSWRMTGPLRYVRRQFVSRPSGILRKRLSEISRKAWAGFPASNENKQRFKDRLFRRLPFLFSWSAPYRRWENQRGDIGSWKSPSEEVSSSQYRREALRQLEFVPLLTARKLADMPIRLVAFYLPQYHAIPENDEWWGQGFTDWDNVRPARPQFVGHYQPRVPGELGYYSLLDAGVQRRQVELAQLYGIEAFCFYFYWFGGRTLLEQPIRNYLEDKTLTLCFCLCWANENWSRAWDGLDSEILVGQEYSELDDVAFVRHVSQYVSDDRYVRVGGKPLLAVYRPGLLPDARQTASRWRRWCRENGIGEIYLVCVQSFDSVDPRKIGFDAAVEFPPNNSGVPNITDLVQPLAKDFACTVYDWSAFVERSRCYGSRAYTLFRGVCPSWDNTARRKNRSSILLNNSPRGYQEWLYNAIKDTCRRHTNQDERLVFVNAWNEWAEGAYLEPDNRYGYAFLEATRMALVRASVSRKVSSPDRRQEIAIVVHAFYLDLLDEILSYLARVATVSFKLYVSCTSEVAEIVRARLSSTGHAFRLMSGTNKGRDAMPFLKMLPVLIDEGYDIFIKVHTKKSVHREDGDLWRRDLLDQLLTDSSIRRVISYFEAHSDVGVIGPDGHVVPMNYYWGSNAERVRYFSSRLGVDPTSVERLRFVAGHMFFARTNALIPLMNLAIDDDCFEVEDGQVDGTMAHAIERLIAVSTEAASLTTCSIGGEAAPSDVYRYASEVSK